MSKRSPRQKTENCPSGLFVFWKMPLWLGIAIAVFDQLSKIYVIQNWPEGSKRVVVDGFFNLVHYRNPGAAWGMLSNYTWLLTLLSILATFGVVFFFKSLTVGSRLLCLAMGAILGGIVGNLIDRLLYGEVVDFLDFYVGSFHWPAFNVADSAITVGVTVYFLVSFFTPESKDNACTQAS